MASAGQFPAEVCSNSSPQSHDREGQITAEMSTGTHKFWNKVRKHWKTLVKSNENGDGEEIELFYERQKLVCKT